MKITQKPALLLFALSIGVLSLGIVDHIRSQNSRFAAGSLLICDENPAVYYVGSDSQRYLFPDETTYLSWYSDFSDVQYVSNSECAALNLGGVVTAKPGTVLVKSPLNNKIYALSAPNTLHHIVNEFTARDLYGSNWSRSVIGGGPIYSVPEVIFSHYEIGNRILSASGYNIPAELEACSSVNECLGLGRVPTFRLDRPSEPEFTGPATPIEPSKLKALSIDESIRNKKSNVGINLASTDYWNSNWPFKDAFKQADPFFSGTNADWRDGRDLNKDKYGWVMSLEPGQIAKTIVIGSSRNTPTGHYTVLYDGEGVVEYPNASVVEQEDGRATVSVGQDGLVLYITKTNPQDYIRNIRVLMPGGSCNDSFGYAHSAATCSGNFVPFEDTYQAEPFHPIFLNEQRPFRILRFTDLMDINRNINVVSDLEKPEVVDWEDYPARKSATWQAVPVDVLVHLANKLGSDAYINIPHAASDNFVRRLASTVKENLDSDLKVYVEYSSEVWNDDFTQHNWINVKGCENFGKNGGENCDPDQSGPTPLCGDPTDARTQSNCVRHGKEYYADRTARVMNIWTREFDNQAEDRLVRVLGGRTGGANWYSGLQFFQETINNKRVHEFIDAYAVAPYFGNGMSFDSVDQAFGKINGTRNGAKSGTYRLIANDPQTFGHVLNWINDDLTYLERSPSLENIKLIAYEGGQHLYGNQSEAEVNRILEINRDPRMQAVYNQFIELWNEMTDNAPFVHFNSASTWNQWGAWGAKEYQGQPRVEAPKYAALVGIAEEMDETQYPDVQ